LIELVRGQRAKVSDLTGGAQLTIGVQIEGPDSAQIVCVALLLGDSQEAISPGAIVFAGRARSDCGGMTFRVASSNEQVFDLDLSRLTPSASKVVIAVGFVGGAQGHQGSARQIRRGQLSIVATGQVVARYVFAGSHFGEDGAIGLGELYRKDNVWRVRALADGFAGGLPTMLSRYKVAANQISAPSGGAAGATGATGAGITMAPDCLSLANAWPGNTTPTVPKDLTRSVGLIVARTAQGQTHTGTGFIVSPGGFFFTCHHVIEDAAHLAICMDGTRVLRNAEVIVSDPAADLALCWITDRHGSQDWLVLAGQDATPALGDELGLLGFPLGVNLGLSVTYSRGIINSLRQRGEVSVLQIDVGAAPGSSGGPVFRRSDGRVVGVLSSGLDVQDRGMLINFATDMRMIWRLGWLS